MYSDNSMYNLTDAMSKLTIPEWGHVDGLPLSNNRDDYLAYFDDSEEAFDKTRDMCWRLFHSYHTYLAQLRENDIEDYKLPFECTGKDKELLDEWFALATKVNEYSMDCRSVYALSLYPCIDPRYISDAHECIKCKKPTMIKMPLNTLIPARSIYYDSICIVCLRSY